jgi:hypothetical protein
LKPLIPPGSNAVTSAEVNENRKGKPKNEMGIKAIAEFEMARAKEIGNEGVKFSLSCAYCKARQKK